MRAQYRRPGYFVRASAAGRGAVAAVLLAVALTILGLGASASAGAKTITCGDPANPAVEKKLTDAQTAQSYQDGDDLDVVGLCLVTGGSMGLPGPTYYFGNVHIYSTNLADGVKCALNVAFDPVTMGNNCGGSLHFADARIDFRAKTIVIERAGSPICH